VHHPKLFQTGNSCWCAWVFGQREIWLSVTGSMSTLVVFGRIFVAGFGGGGRQNPTASGAKQVVGLKLVGLFEWEKYLVLFMLNVF
jgi:hypothetical protein